MVNVRKQDRHIHTAVVEIKRLRDIAAVDFFRDKDAGVVTVEAMDVPLDSMCYALNFRLKDKHRKISGKITYYLENIFEFGSYPVINRDLINDSEVTGYIGIIEHFYPPKIKNITKGNTLEENQKIIVNFVENKDKKFKLKSIDRITAYIENNTDNQTEIYLDYLIGDESRKPEVFIIGI